MQNTEKRLTYNRLRTTYLILHQTAFVAFYRFTGLAYIDVYNLTEKNVRTSFDGKLWVMTKRQKTKVESNILLLDIPKMILNKYKGKTPNNKLLLVM